jgi:benzodiazapine receptor
LAVKEIMDWKLLAAFIAVPLLAGFAGSAFTAPAIPTWYASINKPSFSPPNWLFAPVWTTLFVLMGVAGYLAYSSARNKKEVVRVFGIQLALNTLWSVLFFGLRSPGLALLDIAALIGAIVWNILVFRKSSKTAGWLMAPYLAWVSFATVLNFAVWILN